MNDEPPYSSVQDEQETLVPPKLNPAVCVPAPAK